MKILFCHNYYRYRGGEDLSFEADVRMLRDEGHQVVTFTRDSRQLEGGLRSKLQTVGRSVYSPSAAAEIRELVRTHQPDILHANNLFPLISHSIFDAARSEGVPSIRALRNYRLFCANSYFYRDGEVCTKCLKRSIALPAIQHGCYRDSRSASMVMVASQRSQRRQIRCGGGADAYFAPSQFARQIHIDGGFDPETIYVKPNFVDPDPGAGVGGEAFLFVGRLSSEKGLDTLLQCWRKSDWPHRLDIVGTGPLEQQLRDVTESDPRVRMLGHQSSDEVLRLMGNSRCLIMPSRWYETFGRTIAESFSRGTPVIASDLGAMAELVSDSGAGWLFTPGDVSSLAARVQQSAKQTSDATQNETLRNAARTAYQSRFTKSQSYAALIKIYESVMQ